MGATYNPPAGGAVGNNNYETFLASPINLNNGAITGILSLTVPVAGLYVIEGFLYCENQIVEAGVLDVWLSPAVVTPAAAFVSTTVGVGGVEGRNAFSPIELITIQQLAANASVLLVCFANSPNFIVHPTTFQENAPKSTGIQAWRIF